MSWIPGGEKYLKGIDLAMKLVESLPDESIRMIAADMSGSSSSERFEFLPRLNRAKVRELFRRVWILLLTSRNAETFSYVTAEAQLMGRPVVASNVGGVSETLAKPGVTGDVLGAKYSDFGSKVREYSERLSNDPDKNTREISVIAQEFFGGRSLAAYNQFLQLIG